MWFYISFLVYVIEFDISSKGSGSVVLKCAIIRKQVLSFGGIWWEWGFGRSDKKGEKEECATTLSGLVPRRGDQEE